MDGREREIYPLVWFEMEVGGWGGEENMYCCCWARSSFIDTIFATVVVAASIVDIVVLMEFCVVLN